LGFWGQFFLSVLVVWLRYSEFLLLSPLQIDGGMNNLGLNFSIMNYESELHNDISRSLHFPISLAMKAFHILQWNWKADSILWIFQSKANILKINELLFNINDAMRYGFPIRFQLCK
jgi:hypothetical protein